MIEGFSNPNWMMQADRVLKEIGKEKAQEYYKVGVNFFFVFFFLESILLLVGLWCNIYMLRLHFLVIMDEWIVMVEFFLFAEQRTKFTIFNIH